MMALIDKLRPIGGADTAEPVGLLAKLRPVSEVVNAQHPQLATSERLWINNVSPSPAATVQYLQRKGWEAQEQDGEVLLKQPQETKWHKVEKRGLELADVGDIVNELLAGAVMAKGAALGGIPGAAAGAAGAEAARSAIGRAAGFEEPPAETMSRILTEGVLGGATEGVFKLGGAALKGLRGRLRPTPTAPTRPSTLPPGAAPTGPFAPTVKEELKRVAPKGAPAPISAVERTERWARDLPEGRTLPFQQKQMVESGERAIAAAGGGTPEFAIPKPAPIRPSMFKMGPDVARRYIANNSDENVRELAKWIDLPGAETADPAKLRVALERNYRKLEDLLADKRVIAWKALWEATKPTEGRKYSNLAEIFFTKRKGLTRRLIGAPTLPPRLRKQTAAEIWDEITERAIPIEEVRQYAKKLREYGRPLSKKKIKSIDRMDMPDLAEFIWGTQHAAFRRVGEKYARKKFGVLPFWDAEKEAWRMIDLEWVERIRKADGTVIDFTAPKQLLEEFRGRPSYKIGKAIRGAAELPLRAERIVEERVMRPLAERAGLEKIPAGLRGLRAVGLGGAGLGLPGALPVVGGLTAASAMGTLGRKLMRDPQWIGSRVADQIGRMAEKSGWDRAGTYLYSLARTNPKLRAWIERQIRQEGAGEEAAEVE